MNLLATYGSLHLGAERPGPLGSQVDVTCNIGRPLAAWAIPRRITADSFCLYGFCRAN